MQIVQKIKVEFLIIFVQFCDVTSVAKQLFPQLKPKNVMRQINCWMTLASSPETLKSVECESSSTILNFL